MDLIKVTRSHCLFLSLVPWFLEWVAYFTFLLLLVLFFFNQWIHGYYASNSAPKQCCAVEEFDEVQLSRIHIFSLYFGCMENEECGVWSVEMSIVQNEDCGKRKVWKMGVWKKRNVKKRGKKPKHKSRKDWGLIRTIVLTISLHSSYYDLLAFWW